MRFPDDVLDELRTIYREEFGQEITRDEAAEVGMRLVTLISLLRRPPPEREQPDAPGRR